MKKMSTKEEKRGEWGSDELIHRGCKIKLQWRKKDEMEAWSERGDGQNFDIIQEHVKL